MKILNTLVFMSLIAPSYLYGTFVQASALSPILNGCQAQPIAPNPEWSNVFRWVDQTLELPNMHCKVASPIQSTRLPYTLAGTQRCSSDTLLKANANGCSGPVPGFDGRKFQAACNEHDKCYGTPGMSKHQCDAYFKKNLVFTCSKFFPNCYASANAYYWAVKMAGESYYQDAQRIGWQNCGR